MNQIRVCFFGDSVCVGQYISIHQGWVTRTSASLSELGTSLGRVVTVSNASANGRTTRQALEQMAYEIVSHPPDLLIVQFGMNDCNYWKNDLGMPRVTVRSFEANLEEIVDRASNAGVQKLLLNTNHPTGRDREFFPGTGVTYQESNRRYNEVIRHVADADERILLIDVEKAFFEFAGDDRGRLLELILPEPDLLHLSERGHDLYFEVVYPSVEAAVRSLVDD